MAGTYGDGIDRLPSSLYRARYRDEDGIPYSKAFAKLNDAKAWRRRQLAAVDSGTHINPRGTKTVGDKATEYIEARSQRHRDSTRRRVKGLVDVHIVATPLGKRPLGKVTTTEIEAWASSRVLAPSTLRNLVSLLRSIFAAAVVDRELLASPVPLRISVGNTKRPRLVPLTPMQVRQLTTAMAPRNKAMVTTQAGLGLRVGELLALRVSDVDFLRRAVHIRTQLAPGSRTRTDPKTPTSKRTIPLPTTVADALAAHMAVFPPAEDGSIFYTRTGQPYRSDYYGLIFSRGVTKAELPDGTTSHDLRHAFASWLLAAGESVVAVAELLGHDNATLVLKVYGHLMPGREDHARRAIDAAFDSASSVTADVTIFGQVPESLT